MKIPQFFKRSMMASLVAILCAEYALATEIPLVQYPAGSSYKAPVPNVILSVDDSGSMDWTDAGASTSDITKKRITALKNGLKNVLVNSSKYDGQFRIAWQSLWRCNNIPSSQTACSNKNTMGLFSGQHKTDFGTWVNTLTASGGTPSHTLVWTAGEYMKTTGAASPWNATPGTTDANPVACRRAYHVFMTDGGWNYGGDPYPPSGFTAFNFRTKMLSSSSESIANADGTNRTLPDGTAYSIASSETKIYQDTWGGVTKNDVVNSVTYKFAYPTLSDMAFYYWATDLQPSINNSIVFSPKKSTDEVFESGTTKATITPYWNPKNDPATWQHLVNYTIGYGAAASAWAKTATNPMFTDGMYGGGFIEAILGLKKWTDPMSTTADGNYDDIRPEELWHMAINSRGKFYPVKVSADLETAFSEIFSSIVADNTSPLTSFTSASNSISRNNTEMYQSGYVAAEDTSSTQNRWSGFVSSEKISTIIDPANPNSRNWKTEPNPDWGLNATKTAPNNHLTTADKLDALSVAAIDSRLVLSFNDTTKQGISFEWVATTPTTPLSVTQQGLLNKSPSDAKGKDRLNFIRGDRTKEETQTGGTFRKRKSRQGDIVNSAIWYVGPPASAYKFDKYSLFSSTYKNRMAMVYAGGNDGMLHGFSAKDGTEKIAYVPQGVIKNLYKYTDIAYDHQYYVDGSPFTGDINLNSSSMLSTGTANWKTYLAGTLGAGGKGYFVLDVTKPGTTVSATDTDFIKTKAVDLVVLDATDGVDPDIGYIFGNPVLDEGNKQRALQITRTNDGRSALIMGNGYNSVNERPALLIQYLDNGKELKTISAIPVTIPKNAEANQNGLSTPQFLDINADGIPDIVYAGDLRGNMWKFDISNKDPSKWNVAFNNQPLFTANYSVTSGGSTTSSRQPITTPPLLRPNRQAGGLMVAFGTGQNLTEGDRTDTTSKHTVYSVLDNTRYNISSETSNSGKVTIATTPVPAVVSGRSTLMGQSISGDKKAGESSSAGRDYWAIGNTTVTYKCTTPSCTTQNGWYFDLPEVGERILTAMDFFDGGNIIEIMSEVPASGGAASGSDESCEPSPKAAKFFRTLISIETGARPQSQVMDQNGDGLYNSKDNNVSRMTASGKELRFTTKDYQIRKGSDGKTDSLAKLPELSLRPGWRQLK